MRLLPLLLAACSAPRAVDLRDPKPSGDSAASEGGEGRAEGGEGSGEGAGTGEGSGSGSGDSGSGSGDESGESGDGSSTGDGGEVGGEGASGDSGRPVDPCGDPSVIPRFSAPAAPALLPSTSDADHGSDNIYAPEVLRVSASLCLMYYGGQGSDGHDRIFLATSNDCMNWRSWPSSGEVSPVVDRGSANHVNDPSVVVVGGTWYMYYTVADTGIDDRIHLATSSDGLSWSPQGLVLDRGAAGSWDSEKVGRPSVVHRDGAFYLYYDGNDGTARHVGLATSTDGRSFTRHPSNPLVLNAGAMDVELVADTWLMLHEGLDGTYAYSSADGLSWCDQGRIFALSGASWDQYGQVTPFVYTSDGSRFDALLYGGASDACWCRNRVGLALPEGESLPADPDLGCGSCVASSDCTQACRDGGYGVDGLCAVPGSADPGACCACTALP